MVKNNPGVDKTWELMIVCRTVPPDFQGEIIYADKFIPLGKIPETLKLEEKTARNYLWRVFWINVKGNELDLTGACYDYNQLLAGDKSYGNTTYRKISSLPLVGKVKEGLLKILGELS